MATRVGGIPEVLDKDFLGCLVANADADALAKALGQTLMEAPDRDPILRHASQFSWERTTERYLSVLEEACEGKPQPQASACESRLTRNLKIATTNASVQGRD